MEEMEEVPEEIADEMEEMPEEIADEMEEEEVFIGEALSQYQKPYKWAMYGEWESLKDFYKKRPDVVGQLTTNNDTVLHVVAFAGRNDVLEFLIDLMKEDPEKLLRAFSIRNNYGNTILHEVAASGNQDAATVLMSKENKVKKKYHSYKSMLAIQNGLGETPLYRAAAFGHTHLVKYLVKHLEAAKILKLQPQQQQQQQQQDIEKQQKKAMKDHFERKHDNMSILQIAVISQHFETAIWLVEKCPDLAKRKDKNGLTCLQLLAQMPYAFEAKFRKSIWKMLIYKWIYPSTDDLMSSINQPSQSSCSQNITSLFDDDNCDSERRSNQSPNQNDDLERGADQPPNQIDDLITRNRPIRDMFDEIKNQKCLSTLTRLLVEKDYSWAVNNMHMRHKNTFTLVCPNKSDDPPQKTSNNTFTLVCPNNTFTLVCPNKSDDPPQKTSNNTFTLVCPNKSDDAPQKTSNNTFTLVCPNKSDAPPPKTFESTLKHAPLLVATCKGISKIVEMMLDYHPQAVEMLDPATGQNILHMTIKYRRLAIFNILKRSKSITSRLAYRIDTDGNTILHHAAYVSSYPADTQRSSGPAFQLQEELRWMARVEKIMPSHYAMHQNNQGLTAQKLFEKEHADDLKLAKGWIKETAQSCSTVAALVATVAYAAAFTAPGGNDKHGVPVLRHSTFFVTFAASDIISLIFSLTSLCTFLSILTSPFEYENFRRSLPFRLHLGFALLFFSLVATMLTFTAAVVLLIHHQKMWTTSLIYAVALLPVSVFGLSQFPLYDGFRQCVKYIPKKIGETINQLPLPIKRKKEADRVSGNE